MSALSCGTRGVYVDMLCAIHELDEGGTVTRGGTITGTVEDLGSVCRCTSLEMSLAITELSRKKTVTVTERGGVYTIVNRRMRREYEERKLGAKRQRVFRQNGGPPNTTSSGAPSNGPPESNGNVIKVGHVVVINHEDSLKEKKEETLTSKVKSVFSYWQETLNHPQSKLTPDREVKIRARLQEKYTVEQLKKAIDGCRASAYHMGDNERATVYDSIDLIFRNGGYVDKFIAYVDRPSARFNTRERKAISETQSVIDELQDDDEEKDDS